MSGTTRTGKRKKKPEKEWYVVGPSRWWHLAGEDSPDGVLFKFATEEQATSYIEKTRRSFALGAAYAKNWRVMNKEEWIASQEDSRKEDPQQGT